MVTISLCMIVKNEEAVLGRCLDSIAGLVDEIIIVDTGSSDKTNEVAAGYPSRLYTWPWADDFAAARNYSFSKAEMDYCMWLDADDVLDPRFHADFSALKESLSPDTDIVMMKYNTSFDPNGNPLFSYYRERWIRNDGLHRWTGEVHEAITPCGKIYYSPIAVSHKKKGNGDPDRNLDIYRKLLAKGRFLTPGSNIITGVSFIITACMPRRQIYSRLFWIPRRGGRKIILKRVGYVRNVITGRRRIPQPCMFCCEAWNMTFPGLSCAVVSESTSWTGGITRSLFSGMKWLCVRNETTERGVLSFPTAMIISPIFSFVNAAISLATGKKRSITMKKPGSANRVPTQSFITGFILKISADSRQTGSFL